MKKEQSLKVRRRQAMERLAATGNILEGSLCRVARGESIRYQLTDKVAGRSRTLYIPADMAGEVRQWTRNWKQAKRLLRELSDLSREELRTDARGDDPQKTRTERSGLRRS